ncbi:MAG: TldD/PmbA family protein [Candidatus Latescibacteria bacterium]|nr:TldD/PmbA family protein [Candidatus Latescibacterota bacterium]
MADLLMQQANQALDLAQAAGADQVVAGVGQGQSTDFTFRDGQLEQVQQSASRGLQLILYVDGRYSTHNTTDLRPEALARFVADAVALTRHLQPDPFRQITDPALYEGRAQVELELVDEAVHRIGRDTCLDWLKAMDQAARNDPRVVSASSQVSFGWQAGARVSSNGFSGQREGTQVGYGSGVTLDEGNGRRPEGHRYVHARYLADLPAAEGAAVQALERAQARIGSQKGPSARTNMVVSREAGGQLLGRLQEALSAAAIQQNRSCLADKKDQAIAPAILSVTDNPHLRRGLSSRLYDGEGIAARPQAVIEGGVLRLFYTDTYYGRKLGWQPTGGSASNLAFDLGDKGRDELLAQAGEGYYVNSWLGGNADMTSGDFSFGVQGHRIEDGQLGEPVGEMNITGNYLDLLQNLAAVGNDPNPYSSLATPTLVFEGVEFSGQ